MTTRAKTLEDLFNKIAHQFPEGALVHQDRLLVVADQSRNALFRALRDLGFRVKRAKEIKEELTRLVSPRGYWCATLKQDVLRSGHFCNACRNEVSSLNIYQHGRTCEHCGTLLFDSRVPASYSCKLSLLDGVQYPHRRVNVLKSFIIREASATS